MYFIFVVVSLIAKKKNTTQTFLKEISDLITSQVYIFLCLLCSAFFSPFPVDTHTQTNSYEKYFLVCVRATHSLQSTYISRCSVLAAFISPFIFWFFHWWAAPVVSRYLKHTHTHTAHRPRIGPVVRVYVCVYAGMHFRISVPTSKLFMQHIYENTHTMKMGIVPQHSKRTSQRHTNICINIICSYILVDCCEKFRVFFSFISVGLNDVHCSGVWVWCSGGPDSQQNIHQTSNKRRNGNEGRTKNRICYR